MMTDKAKEARAAYHRAWRKKNPDKARAIKERYWEKKAAELTQHEAERHTNRRHNKKETTNNDNH